MAWGFAPSHYGRWARLADPKSGNDRWGWVPGKPVQHPAYMPAAVAFLGTAGVGISYADAFSPGVAWFPLAPGEAYWPSYASDEAAIRRINAGAEVDPELLAGSGEGHPPAALVKGRYRNRRFASTVPRSVFVAGKPVAPALVQIPERRLKDAPLLAGSPGIDPPTTTAAIAKSAEPHPSSTVRTAAKAKASPRHQSPAHVKAVLARSTTRPRVTVAVARHRHAKGSKRATVRPVIAVNHGSRLHFAANGHRTSR
jgi:hypothetical protein